MITRRAFLASASLLALTVPSLAQVSGKRGVKAKPVPLSAVRLKPSIYADAVERNRQTLLQLDPNRLLHNFHQSARMLPKGAQYGGWEARGVAGQTLGHYLTALSLMWAQTADPAIGARLSSTVAELGRIQAAHGDGYLGGTTVDRNGKVLDGKIIFEELRRGDVRSGGFDVNGGWVPLYTWHKVHAGLIDAERLGGIAAARAIMLGMAEYLGTIIEGLDDTKLQRLLQAEHGGLNDSYAQTYELTGNPRWLRLAERIRHRKVLDPLTNGEDVLQGLHANTQIPKVIGLARLYELTGDRHHAAAARFFHETVVKRHSYVIGGNSEREHFGPPAEIANRISERTCESCNTYNMLKLTRHLHGWAPSGELMDYYERAHLNHIMAHQHPRTGRFVYFMPLSSGARRTYSTEEDSFWCCVGSGLESHSKHGDSVWWHDDDTLYVSLFVPSVLHWREKGVRMALDTRYPFSEHVSLRVRSAGSFRAIAMRLPGWCSNPQLEVNGRPARFERRAGYAVVARDWRAGDTISLTLPMSLRTEPTPDNPDIAAFVHGPVVLAADLGPASEPWSGPAPALVGTDTAVRPTAIDRPAHQFRLPAQPTELTLKPFFNQYDRRTAVYFPRFSGEHWASEMTAFAAAEAARLQLEARTVDVVQLGEQQSEQDHGFAANHSDLFSFAGRSARQLPWGNGNWFEATLSVAPGANLLRALYWGEEVNKNFDVVVEGARIANERRESAPEKRFVAVDYLLPLSLTRGKKQVRIRFESKGTDAFIYELRTLKGEQA